MPYYAHVKLFLLYSFDFYGRSHSNHLHLMAAKNLVLQRVHHLRTGLLIHRIHLDC